MPAWQTSWPRLWRQLGGRTPSWQNRRNAVRTRSPASGARRACSLPRPLGRPLGRTSRNRYRQLFRLGERDGCRVRIESTVLRQNAAVTQPLPINCGGSTPISAGIQVLTYISIGFLSDIIYAAAKLGLTTICCRFAELGRMTGSRRQLGGGYFLPSRHSYSRHKVLA